MEKTDVTTARAVTADTFLLGGLSSFCANLLFHIVKVRTEHASFEKSHLLDFVPS
jgi:hypothetical protein